MYKIKIMQQASRSAVSSDVIVLCLPTAGPLQTTGPLWVQVDLVAALTRLCTPFQVRLSKKNHIILP